MAAGSPPRCGAVSCTPRLRCAAERVDADEKAIAGRGGIGGPETSTSMGPSSSLSPSRSRCRPASRVVAPLTKVPLVDRSLSSGPSGPQTISQWRAEIASVRSAIIQSQAGSRPIVTLRSGCGNGQSITSFSTSSLPLTTFKLHMDLAPFGVPAPSQSCSGMSAQTAIPPMGRAALCFGPKRPFTAPLPAAMRRRQCWP